MLILKRHGSRQTAPLAPYPPEICLQALRTSGLPGLARWTPARVWPSHSVVSPSTASKLLQAALCEIGSTKFCAYYTSTPQLSGAATLMSKRALENETVDEESVPTKWQHADLDGEREYPVTGLHCALPPHALLTFHTIEAYESHYRQNHTNRCLECGRNLPTQHFLDLHIAEQHDPLISIKRSRGEKTYRCLVEGCDKVTSSVMKRRLHLVDKHMFPRNYEFAVIRDGTDGKQSLLKSEKSDALAKEAKGKALGSLRTSTDVSRPPKLSEVAPGLVHGQFWKALGSLRPSTDVSRPPELSEVAPGLVHGQTSSSSGTAYNADAQDITESLSALQFAPRQVRFGQRRKGGGFEKP